MMKRIETFPLVRVTFFCITFPNPCLLLPDSPVAIFNGCWHRYP